MGEDSETGSEYYCELSEEARITPEQERYIKRLGGNRMVVLFEPKSEPDIPPKEPEHKRGKDVKREEVRAEGNEPGSQAEESRAEVSSLPYLDPSKIVSILASYGVPLDAPVRELIKEIKKRGKDHLDNELKKVLK